MALLATPALMGAQQNPVPPTTPPPKVATTQLPAARIAIEEAIRLALQHNHALQAARTTVLQSQAMETTANLRPNPVLSWDAQFLPLFNPSKFDADYLDTQAQFDLGLGYTFERGKKRWRFLPRSKV